MKIGSVDLPSPFAIAPMAGMTDTAFRRLVKRHGGCGLVVTEMVSAEGLVRGIDRTLEYAEYTEEERPISIQIFGGDPDKMAAAAQIVEGMGADIVDVNMGCPVPKIAKHNAGCSLMREPAHAAGVIAAMAKAVKIPVTVKMRAGWNDGERNAPTLAKMVEDAGAAAIAVHGRTAAQSYSGSADWDLVARIAGDLDDSGVRQRRLRRAGADRRAAGVGCRRRARRTRRPAQPVDSGAGRRSRRADCAPRPVTLEDRGRFLLDYIELLMTERVREPGLRSVAELMELRRRSREDAPPSGPGAIARPLGHQQDSRAGVLVHQGARRRVASSDRHQQRRVAGPPARAHRQLLSGRHADRVGRSSGRSVRPAATCRY